MNPEVEFKEADAGTLVPVRVVPRASRTELDGIHDGAIRIRLKAPPVDGAANKELCQFLAKTLEVPKSSVEITAGQQSRSKTILVRGIDAAGIREALLGTGRS